jgi:hypothetical protein
VLAEQDAENGIAAQLVMVDEVLIARRQAEHALRDQGLHFMQHVGAMAPVAKASGEAIDESNGLVRLPEQQRPGVRGDHAAIEIRDHPAPALPKYSSLSVYSVSIGEPPRIGITRSRKTKLYHHRHRCASAP